MFKGVVGGIYEGVSGFVRGFVGAEHPRVVSGQITEDGSMSASQIFV